MGTIAHACMWNYCMCISIHLSARLSKNSTDQMPIPNALTDSCWLVLALCVFQLTILHMASKWFHSVAWSEVKRSFGCIRCSGDDLGIYWGVVEKPSFFVVAVKPTYRLTDSTLRSILHSPFSMHAYKIVRPYSLARLELLLCGHFCQAFVEHCPFTSHASCGSKNKRSEDTMFHVEDSIVGHILFSLMPSASWTLW